MLNIARLAITILFFCSAICSAQQPEWAALKPLVSSRLEVEQVLGKPEKRFATYGRYNTPSGIYSVWYSTGICDQDFEGRQWKVKRDVMTNFTLTFREWTSLASVGLNMADFQRRADVRFSRSFLVSKDESLIYETIQLESGPEIVYSVSVEPRKDDKALLCSNRIKRDDRVANCDQLCNRKVF